MSPIFKRLYAACLLTASTAMLFACASPGGTQTTDASLQTPNMTVPASGITPVKDVIVTPRENDQLELTAAANGTFKFEQVQAVLWCRASQHAKANKYADWSIVKVEQLRPATNDTPMIGRGLVQLVKTPAQPAGGKKHPAVKDWCKDVPKVAVS